MMVNCRCGIFRQNAFQFLEFCLADGSEGFELFEQLLLAFGTNAGNFVQLRIAKPLAPQLPMIRDGEAVGLLLDGTDKGKDMLIGIDGNLHALRGYQRPGTMAVILDHAEYVHSQSKLTQGFYCRSGVADATIDQQQIRSFVETFIAIFIMAETAAQDLTHG